MTTRTKARRPDPPPPVAEPDELDRTARQVRLDYDQSSVHKLHYSTDDPWSGRVHYTRCGEALTAAEGAILTTQPVGCYWCLTGGTRPNR